MGDDPLRPLNGGTRFALRLTPKSSRDCVDGWAQDANGKPYLKARVRAVPEDGKANTALIRCLAKTLGIAKTDIRIVAGHTARLKTIEIAGGEDVRRALQNVGEA